MLSELRRLIAAVEHERDALAIRSPEDPEVATLSTNLHVLQAAEGIVRNWGQRRRPHPRRGQLMENSHISLAVEVLRDAEMPLHVHEIVTRIHIQHGRAMRRSTLSSRVSKLAKAGQVFKQVAPATYGLVEWDKAPPWGPTEKAMRLFRAFGDVTEATRPAFREDD